MKSAAVSKFKLLPYQMLAKRWTGPAFWLIPAGIALGWAIPKLPQLNQQYSFAGWVVAGIGVLLFTYTLLLRRAHIRCHKNNFVIHTPFYPVAFSYQRIEMIRLLDFKSIFSPEKEKKARRQLYADLWGKTVVAVNLKGYPLPLWWLRLWLHPYLLHPGETALVLPVEDWMKLSLKLESLRTAWLETRRQRQGR